MTTITAVEMRIRRALLDHADKADLDVSHRQVLVLAKVAARAAVQSRPCDKEPVGRRPARKAAVRSSAGRKAAPECSATSGSVSGAPGAVSVDRGAE